MAKKAVEELKEPVVDREARIAELEARLKESDRKAEEAALERVCKAMGVSSSEVKSKEALKPAAQPMIRMFVQTEVSVNGRKFLGDITIPLDTARVIQQAIGDRRMRMLRELTGNNWILQELQSGGFAPKLVGQVDISGEKVLPRGSNHNGAVVV